MSCEYVQQYGIEFRRAHWLTERIALSATNSENMLALTSNKAVFRIKS